jgi:hypothetical protein
MTRDIPHDKPLMPDPAEARTDRIAESREAPETPLPSRGHTAVRDRGYVYRLSSAELETMHDIGQFRTVAIEDLAKCRYRDQTPLMQQDLRALRAQGLVQLRTVWTGPKSKELSVAVLTKLGKAILERHGQNTKDQALYAGFVKPAEVRHDAAIYRMFQAERQKIERAGGQIRRVVLDYELKRKVYSPLAKVKALPPAEYAKRQRDVAQANGLRVVHGKIPLPDLRIEYQTREGETARVDLELATHHYHGSHLQAKAEAGFKFYAADGAASRLSRVMEDREITAVILSL